MPPVSNIFLSSSDLVIEKKQKNFPALKDDQIVNAKVEKVISPRHARLYMLGRYVLAKTHTPLKEGDNINLKVTKESGEQVLKIVRGESKDIFHVNQGLLKSLGRAGSYSNLEKLISDFITIKDNEDSRSRMILKNLVNATREISLKSDVPDSGFLKTLIENSGLTWERNISTLFQNQNALYNKNIESLQQSDLKGLAMKLMATISDGEKEFGQVVRDFISNLENLQIINKFAFEESGKYLLPLPVLFNEMLKFGQMFIDIGRSDDSEKNRKDNLIKVSFILEMSNIGDVLADFSILKKSITGSFSVGDQNVCLFFRENIPNLIKKLKSRGFEVHKIECCVVEPEKLSEISFVDKISANDNGVLNLVI